MNENARRSLRRSALLLVLIVTGCGAGATARTDPPRSSHCVRASGQQEIAGELVNIPKRVPERPPLLVAFHGLREAATWLADQTQFDPLAARHGFVVAYPNAVRAQKWQLNHRDGDDDVRHIRAFIGKVVKRVCADSDRVYLTGFSNGAGFAYRAGCELGDLVAAVAPVSGSYRSVDPCAAGSMPTLEIHGRDPWTSTVGRLLTDMKRRNKCAERPVTRKLARGIERVRWPGCDLERIYNSRIGHEWPRRGAYNTSVEVWRFVSRYRRS